jgi:hypothetical protein
VSTLPATGASVGNPSRGGQSHRKAGGRSPDAPPTASGGQLGGARLSTTRRRPSCWVPREGEPSAGPLGQGVLLVTRSSPQGAHAAVCDCRDDNTSVARGGDDEDDPDMSLQSTAALPTSPLHDGSSDGSSSEETPRSPAFYLLMRLLFRSHLAIWCSLCYALRAERRLSAAALFRLNIASSGRGALAGTR